MGAICVIDDDAITRNAIEMLLETEGYEAKCFSSASEFFQHRASMRIDCILTDVEMPGGRSGLDLLAEVAKLAPDCPVIVMTGRGDDAFRSASFALGARDYLAKPFSAEGLFNSISRATSPEMRAWAAE